MSDEATVLTEQRGRVGIVTLNRPKAINALDLDMIRLLQAAFDRFESAHDVDVIVLRGAGERGFCAGGDMVAARAAVLAQDPEQHRFFVEEYHLNARIAGCTTPVVAFMDGLVLGGGIGLAGHASHRLVTETAKIGMPEVNIGFVIDVGGSWLLAHAPGELGTYVALSGEHVGPLDALLIGTADRLVDRASLDALIDDLVAGTPVQAAIDAVTVAALDDAALAQERDWIDRCFAAPDVASIISRLQRETSPAAHRAAEVMLSRSPTSMVVSLELLRRARSLPDLEAALALEYSAVLEVLPSHDLIEGVRAALVDKDRNPQWQPTTVAEVSPAFVAACFARAEQDQNWLAQFRR
jgi:enoyl-CoA hydratase